MGKIRRAIGRVLTSKQAVYDAGYAEGLEHERAENEGNDYLAGTRFGYKNGYSQGYIDGYDEGAESNDDSMEDNDE